jgi:solute carrier family 25 protein 44
MPRPQHRHTIEFDQLDPVKFYTIGPALLLGVRIVTYPAALVKTRLQAQRYTARAAARHGATGTTGTTSSTLTTLTARTASAPRRATVMREMSRGQYNGTWDAFRTIARAEGASALYNGFASKACGLFATNVYITCYERLRSSLMKDYGLGQTRSDLAAGAVASLVSQFIVVPTDLVSQRMAVGIRNRTTIRGHFSALLKEAGVIGLYRGYGASVMTYAPASSVWWATYGFTKPRLREFLNSRGGKAGKAGAVGGRGARQGSGSGRDPGWMLARCSESASGAMAGATAGAVTTPMDVVKVRRQLSPNDVTTVQVAKDLWRADGVAGFTRGMAARVLNMAPSGALIITVYELVKRLSKREEGGSSSSLT